MATCGKCPAPILWATSENNRPIPLDPEPVEGGNIEVDDLGADGLVARVVPVEIGKKRHRSHFATCLAAAEFRKPRGRK